MHLQDEGLHRDDDSFCFNTMTFQYHETFRKKNMRTLVYQGSSAMTSTSSTPSTTHAPIETFKKSIKRDANLFTTFKDGKFWDNWRRTTLAAARAQNAEEVLDSTHTPLTTEDNKLFKEKQKFMQAVFTTALQTD